MASSEIERIELKHQIQEAIGNGIHLRNGDKPYVHTSFLTLSILAKQIEHDVLEGKRPIKGDIM